MRVLDIKNEYRNRRYVLKVESDDKTDIIYIGRLKTDRFDDVKVQRFYVFDQHKIPTVSIYIQKV